MKYHVYPLLALAIIGVFVMAYADSGITGMAVAGKPGKGKALGHSKGGGTGGYFAEGLPGNHDQNCPASLEKCEFLKTSDVCSAVEECETVLLSCVNTPEGAIVTIQIGGQQIMFEANGCSTII